MKKYDVIIVGGGPAGVAASKCLKDNNVNFCLIEKNKFPREKLCGGGLTPKSISLLNSLSLNFNNINVKIVKEVEFFAKNFNSRMKLASDAIMIDRLDFDYNNLNQIKIDNIYELENIIDIEDNVLTTNKDKYEFKYIIFADGVNGYSRKLIADRKFGFCVECEINSTIDRAVLDFNAINGGYGWIFPKTNHITIGLGKFNDAKADYSELLCDFALKHNFKIEKKDIKGYHIPVFSKQVYKKSVIDNKFILVGDAATLVDQVNGEGIYYSLFSGLAAAESVISCLSNAKNLKKEYFRKNRKIYKVLCRRSFYSKILYSKIGLSLIKTGLSIKCFFKKSKKTN